MLIAKTDVVDVGELRGGVRVLRQLQAFERRDAFAEGPPAVVARIERFPPRREAPAFVDGEDVGSGGAGEVEVGGGGGGSGCDDDGGVSSPVSPPAGSAKGPLFAASFWTTAGRRWTGGGRIETGIASPRISNSRTRLSLDTLNSDPRWTFPSGPPSSGFPRKVFRAFIRMCVLASRIVQGGKKPSAR